MSSPINIQSTSRIQVSAGRKSIMHRQVMIPGYRNERNHRGLESAMYIGHCFPDHKHTGANQRKGEKGSDTGHFACQACRNESCQQTDEHHKQQGLLRAGVLNFSLICEKNGGNNPSWLMLRKTRLCPNNVTMMTEQYPNRMARTIALFIQG